MSDLVLIVDADLQTVAWLKARLENEGLHTDSALRGEQAWQKIQATVPAVVVLDPHLPDMDGLDLIYRIRQDPRYINTAVFVLSALVQPSEIGQSISLGANDYILKRPGADIELIAKIQAQLAQPPKTILEAALAKRGRIFSFCSAKGCTGTTSVCVNTACALAKLAPAGTEIVVVDMVLPMGTLGFSLGIEAPNTFAQLSNEVKDKIDRTLIAKHVSQPCAGVFG
jgi:CheY-like chemotaxis protein